ncbi:MAG: YkgJ family cysteine cluster protein [Gammaproteobacteria bacterium]
MTSDEWMLLREGLSLLPEDLLQTISKNISVLAEQSNRPIVCPLLDQSTGTCRIYQYRSTACRTT